MTIKNSQGGHKMNKKGSNNKNSLLLDLKKNKTLLAMLLPAMLYVIIFSYIPMSGIVLAFKNYNYEGGIFGSDWVGFANFRYLIISDKLWTLTRNTILYNAAFITLGMVFEVGFAIILSEMTKKVFKRVTQGIIFLPYFISWVVVSSIMTTLFGYEYGVLNNVLNLLGIESVNIYAATKQWPIVMVLLRLWKSSGYGSVIYLAAIAGVSQELYEAADIDGADIWKKIKYITLPSIQPTMMIMFLLGISNVFRGDFGMFYQIVKNNQLLLRSSDIIDTFVYRSLLSSPNLGMSAAAGLYQSVMCFVTIITVNYIVKKLQSENALF